MFGAAYNLVFKQAGNANSVTVNYPVNALNKLKVGSTPAFPDEMISCGVSLKIFAPMLA